MQLTNNTILITGGTSGIGRALAEALHQHGNHVIIAGRRQHLLDAITAANPGMHAVRVDVADAQDVNNAVAQITADFPQLNVLVNNAGISRPEDLVSDSADSAVALSIIQTNIASVLQLTTALLPALLRQPRATIVATTSGLAFVPLASYPTYCASKAFLHSWLQSLRMQLRNTSVEVLELVPPYVQTELGGSRQLTDPHAMPLDEYIEEVMHLLADSHPPRGEILVERAKALRFAERGDQYERIFAAYNER
jgi:uncharacterized oxidoreductase